MPLSILAYLGKMVVMDKTEGLADHTGIETRNGSEEVLRYKAVVRRGPPWDRNRDPSNLLPLGIREHRYGSTTELLKDLYLRLADSEELADSRAKPYEGLSDKGKEWLVGVLDRHTHEFLCVEQTVLLDDVEEAAKYLGIPADHYVFMLSEEKGRDWIFSGKDPSKWPGPLGVDPEELNNLESLWPVPEESVEEQAAALPEETRYGKRTFDFKNRIYTWSPS